MLADLFNASTGWVEVLLLVTTLTAAGIIIYLQGGLRVLTRYRRRSSGSAGPREPLIADSEDFDRLLRL